MRAAACHGLFLSKRSKGAKKLGFKIDSDQHILRNLILRIHVHVLRIPEIMSLKAMIRAVTEAHAGAMCELPSTKYIFKCTPAGVAAADDVIENAYENAVAAEDSTSVET